MSAPERQISLENNRAGADTADIDWNRLESILERFENAWKDGQRPNLEDYLSGSAAERRALLVELVHEDLEYRIQAGEPTRVEAYLSRFPELLTDSEVVVELLSTEYRKRRQHQRGGAVAEYVQRFPALRQAIEERLPASGAGEPMKGRQPAWAIDTVAHGRKAAATTAPLARQLDTAAAQQAEAEPIFPIVPGYEVLAELGRGGMGVVYKARHLGLNRLVALKMIVSGEHAGPEERLRFLAETEVLARLRHPHIVQIYEVGSHAGLPYFAMEYLEGGSLERRLRNAPLQPAQAAQLVELLADALERAHQHGVVHRDLKPANILMATSDLEPKITDFGLARRVHGGGDLARTGEILGTPSYMAPEQARGNHHLVGPTADIYALGALLYECLTGRPPFVGPTAFEILLLVLSEEPTPVRRLKPSIPQDLEAIVLRCLEKTPSKRYASALELAQDLQRFRLGETVLARPVRRLERLLRWVRRRPALAATWGLLAVVLFMGLASAGIVRLWQAAESARLQEQQALEREADARRQLEQVSYLYQVDLAYRAWKDNNVGNAEQLLAGCDPDLRRWEWGYVNQLCHADLLTLNEHSGRVTCLAVRPDGGQVASASDDRTVKLYDVNAGRSLTFTGHTDKILGVAFSPSGKRLASASWDGSVRVWEFPASDPVLTLTGSGCRVWSVAFSPDGKRIVSANDDGTVNVWNADTGALLCTLKAHEKVARSAAFSPDGQRLVTASYDGTIKLWNASTGALLFTLTGHTDWVLSVAFSPDGQRLVSASVDMTIRIWDLQTRQAVHVLRGHTGLIWRAVFSPSGQQVASASRDRTVRIWDARTGDTVRIFKGHARGVTSVAYFPEGDRLASASWDGTVKLWDVAADQEARVLRFHSGAVLALAYSPDGKRLATASSDATVAVWEATTGRCIFTLKHAGAGVRSVAFSPDGRRLASGAADGTVKLWDAEDGTELLTIKAHAKGVNSVAFSPDGQQLASASADGSVKLWSTATGVETSFRLENAKPLHSVAFSPDGKCLAAAGGDNTSAIVILWDLESGETVLTLQGHDAVVYCVAFSPDGHRLASASWDDTVRLWDSSTGQTVLTLRGHTGPIHSLAFSPDGQRLATASEDLTVKIWEAGSGREILSLSGHTAVVLGIAFSPEGESLATASADHTARIWPGSRE